MTFFKHCCFLKRKNKVKHFDPSQNIEIDSPKINNFLELEQVTANHNNEESKDPRSPLEKRSPIFLKKKKNKIDPNLNEISIESNNERNSLPNQITASPYRENRNKNLIFAGLSTQTENKSKVYYNNNVTYLPENLAT